MSRLLEKTGEELVLGGDFLPTIPRVDVYRSATLSMASSALTAIPWDAETEDVLGMHDLAVNPSRITIPYAGYWDIEVSISWPVAAGSRQTQLYKNGVGSSLISYASAAGGTLVKLNTTLLLAKNDYLEVLGYQDSGGPISIGGVSGSTSFKATYRGEIWQPVRRAPVVQRLTPAQFAALNPANLVDGDRVVLIVDANTEWELEYDVSEATVYKWKFRGGLPLMSEDLTVGTRTATTYGDLASTSVGPSVTVPRAGNYDITVAALHATTGATNYAYTSYDIGATPAVDADAIVNRNENAAGGGEQYITLSRTRTKTGIPTGAVITTKYRASAGTGQAWNRSISILPRKIQGP